VTAWLILDNGRLALRARHDMLGPSQNSCWIRTARGASSRQVEPGRVKRRPIEPGPLRGACLGLERAWAKLCEPSKSNAKGGTNV